MIQTKELGKIVNATFGFGGYQGVEFGLTVELSFGGSLGTTSFRGFWGPEIKCDKRTKWAETDRLAPYAETMKFVADLLQKAKVNNVTQLAGKPVEVISEGMCMQSWRILEEVL